jgi:cytohesin
MGIRSSAGPLANKLELTWSERLLQDLGFDGLDPNQQDGDGLTVLHYAVASDQLKVVEELIRRGARVDLRDREGRTALHRAASYEMAVILLNANADPEARDEVGWTPLHKSARRGHRGAVSALIEFGANIEAVDAEFRTPLHKAAFRGHKEIVELLLQSGANAEAKDMEGNTPLSWAFAREHTQVADVIRAHLGV